MSSVPNDSKEHRPELGYPGRVNLSGSELSKIEAEIGDDVDVDVADTKDVGPRGLVVRIGS